MKTRIFVRAVFALGLTMALRSAPLPATTAVHTKPDAGSPAISFLKAGTEPTAAAGETAPEGWMAVELPGPFEGYVENKSLTKALDVKPGTPIRLAPETSAGVLATAQEGDKTSITGLRGKWTQINLEKKLVGYIQVGAPTTTAAAAPAPLAANNPPASDAHASDSASAPHAAPAPQPAPTTSTRDDGGSSALPRQFAGKFVSTRRPFTPRRPYDYALNDDAGQRYAYLDISKLLLTEQIEKYIGRDVVVFGAARPAATGRDIVIEVETLQLK